MSILDRGLAVRLVRGARYVFLLVALLLVGCETPLIPIEREPYSFRLPVVTDEGETELRTFHWPVGSTIRIWVAEDVEGRPSLRDAAALGAAIWTAAAIFDEYEVVLTDDPNRAHAVVRWDDSEPVVTQPPTCGGPSTGAAATRLCLDPSASRFEVWQVRAGGPSEVVFSTRISPTPGMVQERADALVTHELGHVIGILAHSPNQGDLMWGGAIGEQTELTESDQVTVRTLYQSPVQIER